MQHPAALTASVGVSQRVARHDDEPPAARWFPADAVTETVHDGVEAGRGETRCCAAALSDQ